MARVTGLGPRTSGQQDPTGTGAIDAPGRVITVSMPTMGTSMPILGTIVPPLSHIPRAGIDTDINRRAALVLILYRAVNDAATV